LTPKQRADFLRAAGHVPEQAQASWPLIPVVGVPIVLPCQFFGRTQVLNQIHCAWDKQVPESIAIIGPKRSGKTSLLNYLIHISERLGYAPINPKVGRMGGCRALLTQF